MDLTKTPTYTYSTNSIPQITSIDLSNITTSIKHTSSNAVWTTTTTNTTNPYTIMGAPTVGTGAVIGQSGKITLQGKDADIDIDGKSMKAWMEKVEERLNILTPNSELEKEWDDLRKLGERYRKLEKKCKEKADVWNKLKKL